MVFILQILDIMSNAIKHLRHLSDGDFVVHAGRRDRPPQLTLARFCGVVGYVDKDNRAHVRSCLIQLGDLRMQVDAIRVFAYDRLPDATKKSFWLVFSDYQHPPEIVAFDPDGLDYVRHGETHFAWNFEEQSRLVEERLRL